MRRLISCLALIAAAVVAGSTQAATLRIFSYDADNSATRQTAGGLTFEFLQKLLSVRVLRVRATEGQAVADLSPAKDRVLGPGGLSALIGRHAPERDLYEVQAKDDGPALTSAFCPGAKHAWMAFGRIRSDSNLRIYVLGDGGPNGGARLCQTLDFSFHGEWRGPPGRPFDQTLLQTTSGVTGH